MKKLSESTLMSLLLAVSSSIVSHIESIIAWFCSIFSGLGAFFAYISPALLYLPWRISW